MQRTETEIRPHRPTDDTEIVAISHRVVPQYPTMTVEELRAEYSMVPEGVAETKLVAERDGKVAGYAFLFSLFWTDNPRAFNLILNVDPEQRRRGIGSALHDRALAYGRERDAERIYVNVREGDDASAAFAAKRGFEPTEHVMRLSRLELEHAILDGYQDTADRLAGEGITVSTLAELGTDEDTLRALHEAMVVPFQDEPSAETFNQPFEEWRKMLFAVPGSGPESFWVAREGERIIGSIAARCSGDHAWLYALGVDRAYRGRGVARLLKLRQTEWGQREGIRYFFTGNDINNPRVYDINMRMGFTPLPAQIQMVWAL